MPPPLPVLPDELVEEVLLRIPPNDPATLVRAAAVCKCWRRLVSDAGFRRRFAELHRTPPLLGLFCQTYSGSTFVPTTPSCPPLADRTNLFVVDARHGRVLLHSNKRYNWNANPLESAFVVWDPITDEQKELPLLSGSLTAWSAAVLCSGSLDGSCLHHLDCHGQPFLVFLVGTTKSSNKHILVYYVYSSENDSWSAPTTIQHQPQDPHNNYVLWIPSVLVGNDLYFMLWRKSILKCNLSRREMSFLELPPSCFPGDCILMTTMASGLGVACLMHRRLKLWSRVVDPHGYEGWAQSRVIELDTLLPVGVLDAKSLIVVASPDGVAVIFMCTSREVFAFDLKSTKITRIYRGNQNRVIFPYMSFYTAALGRASIGEKQRAG
ncbi:hypothetical protein PR202_gb12065 [Eleusine coracana subsp. coracana]|uniref:F-box domain-containing protein n=1 Tax=Eleusine coracana subsp. coracana TaxID=191504 RepID=A0AAV5ELT8_ELECO|nr:hypothetical protein PR202_gb12065 [Eleusine coracana subsp. coracana]